MPATKRKIDDDEKEEKKEEAVAPPFHRRIALMPDGSSWIEYYPDVLKLTPEEYTHLWNLHPEERATFQMYGKTKQMHRWNQSYGRSYAFSGQVARAAEGETPEIVQRCMGIANSHESLQGSEHAFNMSLVNWYKDGMDYISFHSDDERQLIAREPIVCFSFGAARKFRLVPKEGVEGGVKADLFLEDGSMIVMGGRCQETHKHSIPTSTRVSRSRVSVTLRKFK